MVRDIAWKAQARLCARYRRLLAKGKKATVVAVAIAREITAFLWDIARHVEPAPVTASEAKTSSKSSAAQASDQPRRHPVERRPLVRSPIRCAWLEAGPRWGIPEQTLGGRP